MTEREPPLVILCETFIPGQPKPKGSLAIRPNGTATDSKASKDWRAIMTAGISMDRAQRGLNVPELGPVAVRASFYVNGLKNADQAAMASGALAPIHAGVGDIDKLTRNLLDAMHDTREPSKRPAAETRSPLRNNFVFHDDVQVVRLVIDRVFVVGNQRPGVFVQCWKLTPEMISVQRGMALAPLVETLIKRGLV
jgi:Holliday junction resolvase RusA-like endonuclease